MIHASLSEIKQGYKGLKHRVKRFVDSGDFTSAMDYIGHCTTIASQFNWIYSDDEIEELLDSIATEVIDTTTLEGFEIDKDNWVFYDDYCTSYVLALQWMTALSKTGKRILYITSRFTYDNRGNISILPYIERMPNVSVEVIQDGPVLERANSLFQSIIRFNASKVILHKAMDSLIQLPLCALPHDIEVYNVNLADQFFWLGVRHIDYNIEFRPFGVSVSLQKRGFKKEQLLMIPYYPANEKRSFKGFPPECEGKTVIFSGGDYYKTLDEDGTYWQLVKAILDRYPNVVFLFATKRITKGLANINEFIEKNHFERRFFYIDYRPDIFQVFAHCDIYMGTTPISGALMSQLAAINEKPILQYYQPGTQDDETEQALCINDHFSISFSSINGFLEEADRLINDLEYRKEKGKRLSHSMIQPSQFNSVVKNTLETNETWKEINPVKINFDLIDKRWHLQERTGYTKTIPYLYSLLGFKQCLVFAPTLFFKKNLIRLFHI